LLLLKQNALITLTLWQRRCRDNLQLFTDVSFHAVRENALNRYNIFVTHCQYRTCYTSANCFSGKSCIAL